MLSLKIAIDVEGVEMRPVILPLLPADRHVLCRLRTNYAFVHHIALARGRPIEWILVRQPVLHKLTDDPVFSSAANELCITFLDKA